jgi:YegS/Rv2252/BmrU family lipid kinase
MIKKIVLIANPIAGGGALDKIRQSASVLEKKGITVHLMLTKKKGDAELFAKEIASKAKNKKTIKNENSRIYNTDTIVFAAGGDGTYNEVANGLAYSAIPMAILPLGTTSVLAKELNLPDNLQITIDAALRGSIKNVHLGKIKLQNTERYFLLMAGIGFDGDVVYNVNEFIKKLIGKGAYILSGLISTAFYNPQKLKIAYNENNNMQSYGIIVGKASCYGGKYKITPDASLFEPKFHSFAFHGNKRRDIIRYVSAIVKNSPLEFDDIKYFSASHIEISSSGAHIQIDGDYIGSTPAKIEIAENALKLVIP